MINAIPRGASSPTVCRRRAWQRVACLALAMLLSVGCSRHYEDKFSRARPPVFKTTGRVTWNGEPAAGALVTLQSQSHNLSASGKTDSKGQFTLTTWRTDDGAVAGEHAVSIESVVIAGYTADGLPVEVNVMPPSYQNPKTSGLNATVNTSGPNVLSFEVVGPRREAKMPGQ
jgi:hypothetical protein